MIRTTTAVVAVLAAGLASGATGCTDDDSGPPVTVETTTTTEFPGTRETQPDGSPQIPEADDDDRDTAPGDADQPDEGG